MSATSRARFAEVVRAEPCDLGLACLLVGCETDPDLDVDRPLATLDALAAAAGPAPRGPVAGAAAHLSGALGRDAGYGGTAADYGDLRSSLLHEVLGRRRGLPLTLTVVYLEVAARLGVPAYPLALPGHVVVGVGDPDDEHVLLDPFSGGRVLPTAELDARVRAATGRAAAPADLRPAAPTDLLLRLLANVRALTTRQDRLLESVRTRLWAVELSLLLPRRPLALHRERGELLVRLGRHLEGAEVLEAYAALVEDAEPAQAAQVRRDAGQARARLN